MSKSRGKQPIVGYFNVDDSVNNETITKEVNSNDARNFNLTDLTQASRNVYSQFPSGITKIGTVTIFSKANQKQEQPRLPSFENVLKGKIQHMELIEDVVLDAPPGRGSVQRRVKASGEGVFSSGPRSPDSSRSRSSHSSDHSAHRHRRSGK